jgi:photosystem II stability/assembly factor-like uncharacterized protein
VGLVALCLTVTVALDVDIAGAHAPHDDVTDIAISPGYAQDQTVFAIVRGKLMRSTDKGTTWQEVVRGLGGETEVLARIAFAPSDARVAYMTTRGNGVLRSNDGGASWQPATGGLTDVGLQEVAVSPATANTVVVSGVFGGLARTSDGGASWSAVPGFGRVTAMAFLSDGSHLVVGDAQGRVATSADGGETWGPAHTIDPGDPVTALAVPAGPNAANRVFAATAKGRLFRSDDGGESFTALGNGLPDEEVRSLELSPDYAVDATLWASTWHSGVFRSTDDGETWKPMTDGLTTDSQADEVGVPQFRAVAAAADGSGDYSLFVGGFDGFFRYDHGNRTWVPVETLTEYIVGLAVSPDFANDRTVAVMTYVKGAFISDDGGDKWRFANEGLGVADVGPGNKFAPLRRLHNVVFSPDYANDGTIFSANWVRIVKSTNRGATWEEIEVTPPPPGEVLRQFILAVSPSYRTDRTVFVATRQGEVFRSEGAGDADTWAQVGSFGERVRTLAVSPDYARDRVLYAGTVAGVYASGDGGTTWKATGPRMAAAQGHETDAGAFVAISPTYGTDGTVFAGTDSGLFVTRDAGRSWTEAAAAPLTPSSQIEAVAISPDYEVDRTVLVSTRERGLLRSTDGGSSFQTVGTELLDTNHLVADFSNPTSVSIQFSPTYATDRTIFAYAQTEVVRSTDGGVSWEVLRLPSGNDVLESLGFSPHGHPETPPNGDGRGTFETPVGTLSIRRVLAAVAAGLACFALLWALGVGGRRTTRGLALHAGGGVVVLAIVLTALAA